MNKKFFAALASATMALSATGSLAVFADDFDTVDEVNNWVAGDVTTNPDGSVVLSETNFPSEGLREAIAAATGVKEGKAIPKADLEKVTAITISDTQTIVKGGKGDGVSTKATTDLSGISAFANLATFTSTSSKISEINLSENKKLETVNIQYATSLNELALPATNSLKTLVVSGDLFKADTNLSSPETDVQGSCPLPILDLSGNKGLNTLTITDTDVAVLDVTNNVFLTKANVSHNKLNTLKLDGALNIEMLAANDNHLYNISLPEYSTLNTLYLQNNKLQSLDVTKLLKLNLLNANNNCIRTLDLSENKALAELHVANNNLGYLDLSKNTALTVNDINQQHVYVNADFESVDLAANFEGLNKDNLSDGAGSTVGGTIDGSVYTFNENVNAGSYVYETGGKRNLRVAIIKADLMNRLYNPNSGEHFYTKDANEKDVLVGLGWKDEGIGWVAPNKDKTKGTKKPVYRLYNPNAGDHHYTLDSRERDALVSAGWKSEGIGWYSPVADVNGITATYLASELGAADNTNIYVLPLFREYNPNAKAAGSHNYTLDEAENDFLCSIGWIPEGIAWYGLK